MDIERKGHVFHIPENIQKHLPALLSFLLIVCVAVIYWPVQNYQFLIYDDQIYVTGNIRVRDGLTWDNFLWAMRSMEAGFWHPLTWISLMLDSSLYRMNAGGYHWTNVLLHIGAALLLFSALYRMTGAVFRSFFVAALFAIHPLHVESVAWIAERKDVLSGFFGMLTLFAYTFYAEKPRLSLYIFVALCFLAGMMSKPMLMTLPVLLLLLDYWPLKRFDGVENRKKIYGLLIIEKIPLFLIAITISLVTFIAEQRFGAISGLEAIPLSARISNALISYVIYMGKMILPVNLAAYYPHPGAWPLGMSLGAGFLILVLTVVSVGRIRQNAYLAVGWFWYLLTLVPVIGFVQLGSMARADRFTYIPLIGLFMAITWFIADLFKRRKLFLAFWGVSVVAALVACAGIQVKYWQNDFTLFQHAVQATENNYKAYHGLGMAYYRLGDEIQAIEHISHSLALKKNDRAHNDLGVIYMGQNKFAAAEGEFRKAVRLKPDNAQLHNNLGAALASQGRFREAIPEFQEALRLDPAYGSARENFQKAIELGKIEDGVSLSPAQVKQ